MLFHQSSTFEFISSLSTLSSPFFHFWSLLLISDLLQERKIFLFSIFFFPSSSFDHFFCWYSTAKVCHCNNQMCNAKSNLWMGRKIQKQLNHSETLRFELKFEFSFLIVYQYLIKQNNLINLFSKKNSNQSQRIDRIN